MKDSKKVKVAFLGSRPISLKGLDVVLDYLEKNPEKLDVSFFAKSDIKPPPGVVHWWNLGDLDQKIKRLGLKRIKNEDELINNGFDLVTMVFHNDIIPGNIVDIVPRGITNLHFGYLPSKGYSLKKGSPHKSGEPFSKGTYRGSNVLTHAILGGEDWHAVTFHFISERIDLGPVIEYAWNPISADTTPWDLQLASEEKAIKMFRKYFPLLIEKPDQIKTIPPGKDKYPYFNRQSIGPLKILDPTISYQKLALQARALAFPNAEPPYFLEKNKKGKQVKRYVIYKKGAGVLIRDPQESNYIQTLSDLGYENSIS